MGTRPSQWISDAAGTLTMIWERFFGDVADVPVVSPMSQSRLEELNSLQLLITSPMYRRHVPRRCWDVPVAYDDMETRLR